ncbi:MAG: hypothetical protein QOF84_5027 [Streptomyces sp.]|jgi:hypothetical protein|nr:hypothetical protein [Streptomyces sp.]
MSAENAIKGPRKRGLAPWARPLCAFGAGAGPWGRKRVTALSRNPIMRGHGQNDASGGGSAGTGMEGAPFASAGP